MSEKQKMLDGHLYQPYSEELYKDREYCKVIIFILWIKNIGILF